MPGKKILIVDDSKIILRLLERDLASAGSTIFFGIFYHSREKIMEQKGKALL